MNVREFIDRHYTNYNSRVVRQAAEAYEAHVQAGGKMMITLAGAMSTARLGRHLSRLIDADLVHGICCTGANLEEDVFNLLAGDEYEPIADWRALRAEDDVALYERGMNRVTDTCIPETVMRHMEHRLVKAWSAATEPKRPGQYMKQILGQPDIAQHFQRPNESWVLAAAEHDIPIWTPGWEDSTTGNIFAANVMMGNIPSHAAVAHGTQQFVELMRWYDQASADRSAPSVGFFQIGGGIAGDFAICSVPCLIQDLQREDTRFWGYFCQISDAVTSYGGYSGAPPNEKITWGKLDADTPKFMIESDATIVAPLIFSWLLED